MGLLAEFKGLLVLLVLVSGVSLSKCISLEEELTITLSQKQTLDKLRQNVASRLPHAYMKQDIYLIKWLRAQHFDLKRAENMLLRNIKWRAEQKMDTIHNEDWSDMMEDYPYQIEGFDKQGQPILMGDYGQWDIRRGVVSGKLKRLARYLDKIMDEAEMMVRSMQQEGKNVTRFFMLLNLDNFNVAQHVCPPCTGTFLQILQSFENHFPGSADKLVLINIGPVFEFVVQILKNQLTPETQRAMKIFGRQKQQWQKYLLQHIDANQLTPDFGGTKRVR